MKKSTYKKLGPLAGLAGALIGIYLYREYGEGMGKLPGGYRRTKYPMAKEQAHRWMSQVKSYQGSDESVHEIIDDNSSMESGRLREFQKVVWNRSSPRAAEFVSANGIGRPE